MLLECSLLLVKFAAAPLTIILPFYELKYAQVMEQNCCKFFTGTIFCIQICSIVTLALSPSWYPSLYPSSYSSYIKSTSLTSQYINIREFQNLQKLVTSKTGHNFCLIFFMFSCNTYFLYSIYFIFLLILPSRW